MATIGSLGEKLDLVIRQGASFGPYQVTVKNPDDTPVDLTGQIIEGQIRRNALDATAAATFTVSVVDAAAGEFSFELTSADTAALVAGETLDSVASRYVWDMDMRDPGNRVVPLFYGECKVFREVSRG